MTLSGTRVKRLQRSDILGGDRYMILVSSLGEVLGSEHLTRPGTLPFVDPRFDVTFIALVHCSSAIDRL